MLHQAGITVAHVGLQHHDVTTGVGAGELNDVSRYFAPILGGKHLLVAVSCTSSMHKHGIMYIYTVQILIALSTTLEMRQVLVVSK